MNNSSINQSCVSWYLFSPFTHDPEVKVTDYNSYKLLLKVAYNAEQHSRLYSR